MTVIRRNLPPNAEQWGRDVEKRLSGLERKAGIVSTNLAAARNAVRSTASFAVDTGQVATEALEEATNKYKPVTPASANVPPKDPTHGQEWIDSVNGNVRYVYVDYGTVARVNLLHKTLTNGDIGFWAGSAAISSAGNSASIIYSDAAHSAYSPNILVDPTLPYSGAVTITNNGFSAVTLDVYLQGTDTVGAFITDAIDNVSTVTIEPGNTDTVMSQGNSFAEGTAGTRLRIDVQDFDASFSPYTIGVTEAIIEQSATSGRFFDGASLGALWSGASYDSTSEWNGNPRWVNAQDNNAIQQAIDAAEVTLEAARVELEQAQAELQTRVESAETALSSYDVAIEAAGKTAALENLYVTGTATINEAVILKLWADVVRAGFLTATEAIIGGVSIKDNTITAPKIVASEELWAKALGAHKITAAEIDTGTLTADSAFIADLQALVITAESFIGKTFEGVTFTGSSFETSANGYGVYIGPENVTDDITEGVIRFNDPTYGPAYSPTIRNTVVTDEGVSKAELTITGPTPYSYIKMRGALPGQMGEEGLSIMELNAANVLLKANSLFMPGAFSLTKDGQGAFRSLVSEYSANFMARIYVGPNQSENAPFIESGPGTGPDQYKNLALLGRNEITLQASNAVRSLSNMHFGPNPLSTAPFITSGGGSAALNQDLELNAQAGAVVVRAGSGLRHPNHATVTQAANARLDPTSGWLSRSTSLRSAKDNIEPVSDGVAERLLQLEPQTWFDKANNERYADYLSGDDDVELSTISQVERVPGLVAEDVLEAGLAEYVDKDTDGNPSGVMYDRLWTLLIPLVREQREQIAELQRRVSELEQRSNNG